MPGGPTGSAPAAAMSANWIVSPGMSANGPTPASGPPAIGQGKAIWLACTMYPTNAAIATRPCLISAWRSHPIVASLPCPQKSWSAKPRGSQKPMGICCASASASSCALPAAGFAIILAEPDRDAVRPNDGARASDSIDEGVREEVGIKHIRICGLVRVPGCEAAEVPQKEKHSLVSQSKMAGREIQSLRDSSTRLAKN